jgi:hypothetical protein
MDEPGNTTAPLRIAADDAGLCGHCINARIIETQRGSTFLRCQLSFTDPRFAKYPRLPVRICSGYAQPKP